MGHSCDVTDTFCVAYLWENGVTDLNSLIPPGLSLYLYYAGDINDRGEIAGIAVDPVTGASPAFLAIPCDGEHAHVEGCDDQAEAGRLPYEGLARAPDSFRRRGSASKFSSGEA